jgi:hypothetical protein
MKRQNNFLQKIYMLKLKLKHENGLKKTPDLHNKIPHKFHGIIRRQNAEQMSKRKEEIIPLE